MNTIHTNVNSKDSIAVKAGTVTNVVVHTESEGAVVIYGRGGHLGDFKVIVDSFVKHDLKAKYDKNIAIKHIERKKEFLDYLIDTDFGFKINELHIFSHAFGDGLSLAYEDPALAQEREVWTAANLDHYYTNGSPETGTHMEVLDGNKWIKTDEYKKVHGSYPSGTMRHRMRPDKGDYIEFKP